jgi:ribosomal protein S18 acetylase RimI-like enzyme
MANFQLSVREALLEDATGIAEVHVETWRAAYAGLLPENLLVQMDHNGQRRSWEGLLKHPEPGMRVLIAEAGNFTASDNTIIGFGSCGPVRGDDFQDRGEVYTLYVLPEWQNRGAGQHLFRTLLGCLTGDGYSHAKLWVLGDNPSRFFYERVGGTLIDERSRALGGKRMREIAYIWPLRQDTPHLTSLPYGQANSNDGEDV